MQLHREGTTTILLAIATASFALFGIWSATWPVAVSWGSSAVLIVLLGIIIAFFRVPRRDNGVDASAVYAPADGKVVAIEEVTEPEYFHDRRLQVSIFMSPLNVHVNWYPVGGRVTYTKYHPGKYLVAWHPKSSTENERSTVVVHNEQLGDVLFRQIAGALARRICTYSDAGTKVAPCSEFGFIKFGSRVDVLLPMGTEITVGLGQMVRGAETIIARKETRS
ncbi:MAG: phosphatidylserine decarboxylase family protein [Flavobacteriales bacterium]|nr:phosphatidylserine decarboxylase family protein [Flavobacteriales bacterium]MCB9166064.1 phosphatidylserine decarboxylase family protein [Flavobacteriales bacterium]